MFPLFFQRTKTLSRSFLQSCIPSGGHMSNAHLPASLLRSFTCPSCWALQWFYLAYPSLSNSQVDHISAIQTPPPPQPQPYCLFVKDLQWSGEGPNHLLQGVNHLEGQLFWSGTLVKRPVPRAYTQGKGVGINLSYQTS